MRPGPHQCLPGVENLRAPLRPVGGILDRRPILEAQNGAIRAQFLPNFGRRTEKRSDFLPRIARFSAQNATRGAKKHSEEETGGTNHGGLRRGIGCSTLSYGVMVTRWQSHPTIYCFHYARRFVATTPTHSECKGTTKQAPRLSACPILAWHLHLQMIPAPGTAGR